MFSVVFLLVVVAYARARPVNYGSVIQLENVNTGMRLFSMGTVTWGNGGQIVSGLPSNQVNTDLEGISWIVRSPTTGSGILSAKSLRHFVSQQLELNSSDINAAFDARPTGSPVPCGGLIRLEHSATSRDLHSQNERAPITDNYEVVGFAEREKTAGNANGLFEVVCSKADAQTWNTEEVIHLRHLGHKGYLIIEKRAVFNQSNCPRCPIQKHGEAAVSKRQELGSFRASEWKAHTVMAVSLTEEDLDDEDILSARDEL